MEKAFKLSREQFWINKNQVITDKAGLQKFYRYRRRLLQNEPIAYILKEKEFYGLSFFVDRGVLIPRPETEVLVEQTIKLNNGPVKILDIGSGSGNIAISLALDTDATIVALEKSKKAVSVLKKNIARYNLKGKINLKEGDLFPHTPALFDIIVSNPPYIPEPEWRQLDPTVRDYEPKEALAAGEDGLSVIRRIIAKAGSFLRSEGRLLMEIGYNQKDAVEGILRTAHFKDITFYKDYSNVPRVVSAQIN